MTIPSIIRYILPYFFIIIPLIPWHLASILLLLLPKVKTIFNALIFIRIIINMLNISSIYRCLPNLHERPLRIIGVWRRREVLSQPIGLHRWVSLIFLNLYLRILILIIFILIANFILILDELIIGLKLIHLSILTVLINIYGKIRGNFIRLELICIVLWVLLKLLRILPKLPIVKLAVVVKLLFVD